MLKENRQLELELSEVLGGRERTPLGPRSSNKPRTLGDGEMKKASRVRDNSYKKKIIKNFGRKGGSGGGGGGGLNSDNVSGASSWRAGGSQNSHPNLRASYSQSPERSLLPVPSQPPTSNISALLPEPTATTLTVSHLERSEKAVSSLELRLAGSQRAIRSLETSNHEKEEVIDSLREELARKTRMLEAVQAQQDCLAASERSGQVASAVNMQMRKRERELEARLRDAEAEATDSKKHMQRVQDLNQKLIEKMRYDHEATSALQEEGAQLRSRIQSLTSERKTLYAETQK